MLGSGSTAAQLRVLGTIEVIGAAGALTIRDGMPRKLLAALTIRAGAPVSVDVLVDDLWTSRTPTDARNSLQVLVSYLRGKLSSVADDITIERGSWGYQLVVADPLVIDAVHLQRAVDATPSQWEGVAPKKIEAQLADLNEALTLWRGNPYADVMYEEFAQAEVARLQELRVIIQERQANGLLALGRTQEATSLLQPLVVEHPLRESVWAALILALYRSGRQADALRAYATAREHFVEDVGLEPGPELRDLERRVLAHDPTLDWMSRESAPASTRQAPTRVIDAELPAVESRVPVPVSGLVGRDFEIQAVAELLETHRLVTLVGPGGVGKSRLGIEVARGALDHSTVLFIELGAIRDAGDVAMTLAAEVGVSAMPGVDPLEAVAVRLGSRPTLLVLDTCEHLVDALAAAASLLLRRNADLRILATSRQALGVGGEVSWPVPALELADEGAGSVTAVTASGAVRLFVERARRAKSDFELTDDNAADVARICRTLDGLPLAIELAAARVNVLSPARIVQRLDDRFALLSKGERDAEARQQSLRSAIEWSYQLLGATEQRFFARLSVFPASFDLDAAEAIAGGGLDDDALELLGGLVERSLVVAAGTDRFSLLDSLRAFAAVQLAAGGGAVDPEELQQIHARWYAAVVLDAGISSPGPLPQKWPRLRAESANLVVAVDRLFAGVDAITGAKVAAALAGFLIIEGRLTQADQWLIRARDVDGDDSTMARVWRESGVLELYQSRFAESLAACRRSLVHARRVGDDQLIASTLLALGSAEWGVEDYDAAVAAHREAADLFQRHGDHRGQGFALARLGRTLSTLGDESAVGVLEEASRLLPIANDDWMSAIALEHLASALLRRGQTQVALELAKQAADFAGRIGSHAGELAALLTLGRALVATGDLGAARQAHAAALARAIGMGNPGGTAEALEALAPDVEAQGDVAVAVQILSCADAVRLQHHVPTRPTTEASRAGTNARLEAAVGTVRFAELRALGERREPAWALEVLDQTAV